MEHGKRIRLERGMSEQCLGFEGLIPHHRAWEASKYFKNASLCEVRTINVFSDFKRILCVQNILSSVPLCSGRNARVVRSSAAPTVVMVVITMKIFEDSVARYIIFSSPSRSFSRNPKAEGWRDDSRFVDIGWCYFIAAYFSSICISVILQLLKRLVLKKPLFSAACGQRKCFVRAILCSCFWGNQIGSIRGEAERSSLG